MRDDWLKRLAAGESARRPTLRRTDEWLDDEMMSEAIPCRVFAEDFPDHAPSVDAPAHPSTRWRDPRALRKHCDAAYLKSRKQSPPRYIYDQAERIAQVALDTLDWLPIYPAGECPTCDGHLTIIAESGLRVVYSKDHGVVYWPTYADVYAVCRRGVRTVWEVLP